MSDLEKLFEEAQRLHDDGHLVRSRVYMNRGLGLEVTEEQEAAARREDEALAKIEAPLGRREEPEEPEL